MMSRLPRIYAHSPQSPDQAKRLSRPATRGCTSKVRLYKPKIALSQVFISLNWLVGLPRSLLRAGLSQPIAILKPSHEAIWTMLKTHPQYQSVVPAAQKRITEQIIGKTICRARVL